MLFRSSLEREKGTEKKLRSLEENPGEKIARHIAGTESCFVPLLLIQWQVNSG